MVPPPLTRWAQLGATSSTCTHVSWRYFTVATEYLCVVNGLQARSNMTRFSWPSSGCGIAETVRVFHAAGISVKHQSPTGM